MAAAMLAGPAAQIAGAQTTGSGSGTGAPDIASESPANRAIDGAPGAQLELKLGSAGQAVAAVQRRLGVKPADGSFGESTDRAVRVFQGNAGLKVDGIVGPRTWQALFGGGSGGGTGPAADSSGSTPVLVPAVNGKEQRTDFAVRRASESELEQLNVGGTDLPKPTGADSGLAAIEFRIPDDGGASATASGSGAGEASGGGARSAGTGVSGDSAGSGSGSASDGGESGSSTDGSSSDGSSGAGEDSASGGEQPAGESPSSGDSDSSSGSDRDNGAHSGACGDTLRWPTDGKFVTSPYGPRWGRQHTGIDIDTGTGDRIRAAACGVISFMQSSSQSGGYGNFICVKHTDRFVTCYAHLSRFANVKVGDYVHAGETIGYSGCTGNCFGDHLHFETRSGNPYGGNTFDPRPYLDGRSIPGTPVRASSVGGPDLQEPQQPQVKSASASSQPASASSQPASSGGVSAAEADSERSAVQVATDDGSASADSSTQGSQEVAAPAETDEQPAAKPAAIQPAQSDEPAEATTPAEQEPAQGDEGQDVTGDAAAGESGEATGSPADEQAAGDEPASEEAAGGEAGSEEPSSEGGDESDSPSAGAPSGDEGADDASDAAGDGGSGDITGGGSESDEGSSSTDGSTATGGETGSGSGSADSGVTGDSSSTGATTTVGSPAQGDSTSVQGAAGGQQASTGDSTSASGTAGAPSGTTTATGSNGGGSSTTSAGASADGSGSAGAASGSASGSASAGATSDAASGPGGSGESEEDTGS